MTPAEQAELIARVNRPRPAPIEHCAEFARESGLRVIFDMRAKCALFIGEPSDAVRETIEVRKPDGWRFSFLAGAR